MLLSISQKARLRALSALSVLEKFMFLIFTVLIILFVCKPTKDFALLICLLGLLSGKVLIALVFFFLYMAGSKR